MAIEFVNFNPYDEQLEKLRQRQRMADLLQQQAMQPLESQTAPGGYVVPTSPLLGLTKLLQSYMAGKAQRGVDTELSDLRNKAAEAQRAQEAATTSAEAGIAGRMFGEKYTPPAPAPAVDYDHQLGGTPMPSSLKVSPSARFMDRSIEEAGQRTLANAAELQNGKLEEITPTARYQYDPQSAFQMAMTPAGREAMKGNPALATMLANMVKPKTLEVGAIDPSKFTPESIREAQTSGDIGRLKPVSTETKAPTTVGGMQWDPTTKKWAPIPGYTQQAASIAAASRAPESPVAVMGADGKPIYVSREKAMGQTPYTGTTVAQDVRAAAQEQARNNASLSAQQTLNTAEQLYAHPGREAGTGKSSFVSAIPGTSARDFRATLDTFKAQTFLPMVSALRGMGALSDAEGRKLSEAVGALDPGMSEEAFAASLKQITKDLYDKAKVSGLNVTLPSFAGGTSAAGFGAPPPGAVRRK